MSDSGPYLRQHECRPAGSPAVKEREAASTEAALVPCSPLFTGLPAEAQHSTNMRKLYDIDCSRQAAMAGPGLASPEGTLSHQHHVNLELLTEGCIGCKGFPTGPECLASTTLCLCQQHSGSPAKRQWAPQHVEDVIWPFGGDTLSGHFKDDRLRRRMDDVCFPRMQVEASLR